ncbi:MAG TPA: cupin domain-containing protein [Candidatus Binatia bacterium]|nr:cupin domain-containing protein [Candidatus Binatia bacterium]
MKRKVPPRLPALNPAGVPELRRSLYPEPFRSRMGDRAKRRLGEACGLTQFGVNLVVLGPGGQSALRHWHTHEDEFVYVLSGELILITNGGEQVLAAGMCAGYPAGTSDAHHMVNRSGHAATYLEVGSRKPADQALYPDDDLVWMTNPDGSVYPSRKTGEPYPE